MKRAKFEEKITVPELRLIESIISELMPRKGETLLKTWAIIIRNSLIGPLQSMRRLNHRLSRDEVERAEIFIQEKNVEETLFVAPLIKIVAQLFPSEPLIQSPTVEH